MKIAKQILTHLKKLRWVFFYLKFNINIIILTWHLSVQEPFFGTFFFRNIVIELGGNFELHFMNTNIDEINLRRIERNKNLQVEFHTTDENFHRAINNFESPVKEENFIESKT